jgi:CubicO group peptidase (beta-lactamase class C family)
MNDLKSNIWVIFILLSLSGMPALAKGQTPEETRAFAQDQNISQRLDSLFKAVAGDPATHFNGVVLVADHGKILYKNAKGYADIDKKILNTYNTRFGLASLAKVFTCLAVMQLKDQGKLTLDDPVVKFLPDFPYQGITIRQLLSHTSGLPDFMEIFPLNRALVNGALTNQDIIPALKKSGRLVGPPGGQWSYSSPGMGLLVLLVEKLSGMPFQQYFSKHICTPAGMEHTYISTPLLPVTDPERAVQYMNPGSASPVVTAADSVRTDFANPFQTIIGPGLVVSSAEDLLRFDQALYSGKLLSDAGREEMFSPVKLTDGSLALLPGGHSNAGLDWEIDIDTSAGKVVMHNGGNPGIATILLRNLRTRQTVILLENVDNMAIFSFGLNAMNLLNHKPLISMNFMLPPPNGPHPGTRPADPPAR